GETTASITVTPDTTTAYTVTGPNAAGCYASATVVVYVTELPIADAGADQNLCLGSTATLKGNGGTDYIWSTVETTDSILVSPLVTSTYSVTVSNECGSDTDEITVTVVGLPVADAGTIKYINAGDTTTLDGSATGGNGPLSYLWDPAQSIIDETIDTAFAHPSTTTLYILTVTDSLGCVALDSTAILIDSIPYVDAGPAIIEVCSGLSTVLPAVVYGGAQPVSYAWLPVTDLDDPAILNPTTSTTITRTYTLVVTAANGRTASDSIVVSVLDAAVAEAGFDKHICPGSSSTLKASGGLFFEWNTGETTPRITVTPADTTTYYVTVTNSFGCVSDDSVTVFVFPEAVGSAETIAGFALVILLVWMAVEVLLMFGAMMALLTLSMLIRFLPQTISSLLQM
ncbi:MAG: PKD domain-containing protein, partial [Bacteroidetes bacterium]|nr:PKD domain-containing protein [Bacteroidota bacterium]